MALGDEDDGMIDGEQEGDENVVAAPADLTEGHGAHHVCVNAATAKLPPFFPGNPSFWFVQVESRFRTKSIKKDLAKFDHVMAALSEDVAFV